MIKFSIAIPAFKSLYLKECIDSILNQTYSNFELIVVNDCSPHPVEEIVSRFNSPKIKYFKNERNIGAEYVVDNWNKCLEQASGDFFVLMGDDDVMQPDYLQEFVNLITKYPDLDVYHCRSNIINEKSEVIKVTPSCPEFETVYENMWHRVNFLRVQFISDFVFRTKTLKHNQGFYNLPLAWASDDITVFIASTSKGIAYSNNIIFNYRRNDYNISSTGNYELKLKSMLLEKIWYKNFLAAEPKSQIDFILYNNIKASLTKYIQKKKIMLLSKSFQRNVLGLVPFYFFKRRKYQISTSEVLFTLIVIIRNRISQKKYNE